MNNREIKVNAFVKEIVDKVDAKNKEQKLFAEEYLGAYNDVVPEFEKLLKDILTENFYEDLGIDFEVFKGTKAGSQYTAIAFFLYRQIKVEIARKYWWSNFLTCSLNGHVHIEAHRSNFLEEFCLLMDCINKQSKNSVIHLEVSIDAYDEYTANLIALSLCNIINNSKPETAGMLLEEIKPYIKEISLSE